MNGRVARSLRRIGAIVVTDLRLRTRRPASFAVLLVVCVLAYKVVPDFRAGHAALELGGHRIRYDSAAISIVTALPCALVLAMLGFYLVSSSIRRDLVTRTGTVIAATPVRSAEYLLGKFVANASFLALVVAAYIANVMVMQLLRGEAGIEPLRYLATYVAMTGPVIVMVSAFALAFECVGPLSGRAGDVAYLFVWIVLAAVLTRAGGPGASPWWKYADVFGVGFLRTQIGAFRPHEHLVVGYVVFDPAKSVWTFPGIRWTWAAVLPRLVTTLAAMSPLLVAGAAFPRFDPAVVRASGSGRPRALLLAAGALLEPLGRAAAPLTAAGTGVARVIASETVLGFMLSPALVALLAAAWIASAVVPLPVLKLPTLPLLFLLVIAAIADIASRDGAAGTGTLLLSAPHVREAYAGVKLGAAATTAALFLFLPLVRLTLAQPGAALSLLIGIAFLSAAATGLGLLSGGPKAFGGLALLFLYVVVRTAGTPALDFAGFMDSATATVRLGYAAAALAFMLVAYGVHRRASRR